ncbi:MAG: 7-cyano-7-deazaguanine synthase QueC, partial [Acidiferrobacterales bacterium]
MAAEKRSKGGSDNPPRAVVLVSGGLDSATVLAIAKADNIDCYALSFDYGQRHRAELIAAKKITTAMGVNQHQVMSLDLTWMGGSALTDGAIPVPVHTQADPAQIPITYVPARNTIFLSVALGWAEVLGASRIYLGVNAVDYSGYPDCRPEFLSQFQATASLGTRAGVEGQQIQILAPLIALTKKEII